jgi:hypothetical protein
VGIRSRSADSRAIAVSVGRGARYCFKLGRPASSITRSALSGYPASVDGLSKAHQAHVSSLSRQAFSCIRPVMRDGWRRHGLSSRFPVAFRLPAFASWVFLSRQGIVPFLRSAYPSPLRARVGTSTGRVEPRRGTGISTGPFPWPALRTRRAHY